MDSKHEHLHDLRNEMALLHQGLRDYRAYAELGIEPADYYSGLHERIAQLIADAYEAFGQTDVQATRVAHFGREADRLTTEEGAWVVTELIDAPLGVIADPEKLKRQRRERDQRTDFLRAAMALEQGKAELARTIAAEALERASRGQDAATDVRSARRLVEDWQEEAERLRQSGGISVGLPMLKRALGPLFPGAVFVVGAATGNGKSSLVAEVLLAAADDGTPAGLVSMEDSMFVTTTRWLSGFCGVSARRLHKGEQLEKVGAAAMQFAEYDGRVLVSECIGGTEQDVMARMSVMARRGAKLIVVDYLGEVGASVPQQDRRNEIRWLVKRLKAHALRLGVALILVSQLSRPQRERAEGYEPNKHDLKEAGDVENAAEFIVLLWRSKEHDFAPVNLKLAKSKVGGMGVRWEMQREIFVEDRFGNRTPGSARLREVVRDRTHLGDREFPLLVEDYEAVLSMMQQR